MLSVPFIVYTIVLSIFPLGVLSLLITQILADKYGKKKINDKVQRILLYSVYISALMCCCIGYSLHHSQYIPSWCQIYGLPPCFAVLGSTKAFLYAFFLRRARKANVWNIQDKTCAIWLFDRIGPIYIFIYWLIYVVLAGIFFSGKRTDKDIEHVISWCLFDSWKWWFVIFSNSVDVFNSIVTLLLFLRPLVKSVRRLSVNNDNVTQRLSKKFMTTMRWNAVLSFIATTSSVMLLVCIPIVKEYIWLFCAGDPFINSVCVFMMMAPNRKFIRMNCLKQCGVDIEDTTSQTHTEHTIDLPSNHADTKPYNMGGIPENDIVSSPDFMVNTPETVRSKLWHIDLDSVGTHSSVLPRRKKVPSLEFSALSHSF